MEPSDIMLDFGKHRGKRLGDVPTGYLRWLLSGCDRLDPATRQGVKEELARRGDKYLDAWTVLADVEENLTVRLAEDDSLDHVVCGTVLDHVLEAFEHVRELHGIEDGATLLVRKRVDPAAEPGVN